VNTPHCEGVQSVDAGIRASAADAAASCSTPLSNHGVKSAAAVQGAGSGLFDYLTFTVSAESLAIKDSQRRIALRASGIDAGSNAGRVTPSDVLDWLLPLHKFSPDVFESKGWQGYKERAEIFAPGMSKPVGLIARGGNRDTLCVSITGAGMPFVNVAMASIALEAYKATITRLDAAYDDLDGSLAAIEDLKYDALCGCFDTRGPAASRSFIDDLGTGSGCSLYVGMKGNKQLNVYEKGKQQGDPLSPWVRYEARIWANNRVIGYSMLDNPRAVLLGAYPHLKNYLPAAAPSLAATSRAKVEANGEAMIRWLRSSAGKSLSMLRESAAMAGVPLESLLDTLSRDGMPGRFAGTPDTVAIHQTADYLRGIQS